MLRRISGSIRAATLPMVSALGFTGPTNFSSRRGRRSADSRALRLPLRSTAMAKALPQIALAEIRGLQRASRTVASNWPKSKTFSR